MYTLTEAWIEMFGRLPDGWDGNIYCTKTDADIVLRTNATNGFMAAYTFSLIREGWITLLYNGHEVTLHPDDLFIYSPGMESTVIDVSEKYQGYCMLVDEKASLETPNVRDLVNIAYQPLVRLHESSISLPQDTATRLAEKMEEIISYLHSNHIYKEKILPMLFSVFLLDFQDAQKKAVSNVQTSTRVEEIFIGFMRLLPDNFADHHDIAFYASALNISSVYLSRVIRQVSGHTVMDYINHMLATEANYLISTSELTIGQIADRLGFADIPSFSKFFKRHKGLTPRDYRNQKRSL